MYAEGGSDRYKWIIVAISSIILAVGGGVFVNLATAFFKPLIIEFGWPRGSASLIYTAGVVGMALGGVAMGYLADRTTARRIGMFGVIVLGVCLVGAGRANELWQFYLLFFLGGFLGGGSIFAPIISNVGNWFKTNFGLALGITSAGQALGQGGMPYVAALLIGTYGWRDAYSILGISVLLILFPLMFFIRQPPPTGPTDNIVAGGKDEAPVLPSSMVIIWLSPAVVFCCICMSVPLMHLVPLVQDRGYSLQDGAQVLFMMLAAGVAGRIAFGKLADLIGPIRAYFAASSWQTILVLLFAQMQTLDSFYIFAPIFGFGYAGVMTGVVVSVRALTPLSNRAFALGIVTMFAWFGHGIGGYQGGLLFDLTGTYTASYATAALAGVVNLLIVGSLYMTIKRRRAVPELA